MSGAMQTLMTSKQWELLMDEIERDVDEGNWYKEENDGYFEERN